MMQEVSNQVAEFLKKYQMHPEQIDIDQCCGIFLKDMENGLAGKDSSLEMIPTYMETEKQVPKKKKVIVMDAGGTNFRVAVVHFDNNNKAIVENYKTYPMPGVKEEVSKEEFFDIMASYIEEILDSSTNIGFCFSYPTEIFPSKDGKLIRFSKEIKAPQVQGQMIGENLNAALASRGYEEPKHVVILNDTVTTLLAGRAVSSDRKYDSYVGFILGTGTNCAYVDSNKNITKKADLDQSKAQIINCESGGFGKAPMGIIDKKYDATTKNPGQHTFEKMISGAYIGPLCLMVIQQAADDGLFSTETAIKLKSIKELSTKDINDFVQNPLSSALASSDEDNRVLACLIEKLIDRAAKLTAINLSSVVLKSGKGQNPDGPVCIVAEGTTFYKLQNLKSAVEGYLNQYLREQKGRFYEIVSIENATLIGAAVAGLTN